MTGCIALFRWNRAFSHTFDEVSCGPLSTHTSRPAWNSNTGASIAPHMSGLSTARESAIAWFAQSNVAALVWHVTSAKRCLWNQRMRASEAPR